MMNSQVGHVIQISVAFPIRGESSFTYEWRPVFVKVRGVIKDGIYVERLGNEIFLHYSFGPTLPPKYYFLDLNRKVTMPCYNSNVPNVVESNIKRDIEWNRKGYEFVFC